MYVIDKISTHDDLKIHLDKPGFLLVKRRSQNATKIHLTSCRFVVRDGAIFVTPNTKRRQEVFWSDSLGEIVKKLLEISICKLPDAPNRICMTCKKHIPQVVIDAALRDANGNKPR